MPRQCNILRPKNDHLPKVCGKNFPFFQRASSARKIHERNPKERWRSCGKMGNMGLEKMGKLSKLSHFPPILLLSLINFTHSF